MKDVQTEQKFFFICDKWLAIDKDDGEVCRESTIVQIISVSGKDILQID